MARSSTSLPTSPLPFGADTHIHNAYRRSLTALGGSQDQAKPDQQDYGSFVAASQAEDVRSQRASASIPPSSVKDLPLGHRNLLRRHKILLCLVSIVFEISLIALTAGIVLCAVRAHEYNADGGGKAAFVIVGVFGFAGMIGSAAVGWLVWQGRRERARLEERWTVEEQMKERRSVRESSRANAVLRSIKERERSLSRSRSRSRGRASHRPPIATREERPYSELIPSFRAMTETATEAPSIATERARDSTWTNRLDTSVSEAEGEGEYTRNSVQTANERLEQEIIEHMSRPTTPGTPVPGSPNISEVMLANSPTLLKSRPSPIDIQETQLQHQHDRSQDFASSLHSPGLFDFTTIEGAPLSPPPRSPLPTLPTARSSAVAGRYRQYPTTPGSPRPSPSTQNTSILNFSPLIDPAGGIHPAFRSSSPFELSPDLRSSRQNVSEAVTAFTPIKSPLPPSPNSSRPPPITGSSHQHPSTPLPHTSLSSAHSPTLLNSSPMAGPTIHPTSRSPPPSNPHFNQQTPNPNPGAGTGTGTTSTLLNSTSSPPTIPTTPIPTPSPTIAPPTTTTTTNTAPPPTSHTTTSTTQSDENFLAMLSAPSDDANSEDEARLAARRVQSQERVRAWASEASLSHPSHSFASRRERSEARSGGEGTPYLTGREEDAGGVVRRGLSRVGRGMGFRGFGARGGGGGGV